MESTLTFPCEKLQQKIILLSVIGVKSLQEVVIGVRCHEDEILQAINDSRFNKLEEDVVAALVGLLVSHTGLLKQIDVNEATSQFAHVVEVDPDELAEP